MSLLELKLTILEDCIEKNKDRWDSEYIREHWKFDIEEFRKDIFKKGGEKSEEVTVF